MKNKEKFRAYLDHYNAEITIGFYTADDGSNFHVYRESTADGYEVYIAKYTKDDHVNVIDDLHYYNHDLTEVIVEKVKDGEKIHVDEDIWNDLCMEEVFWELYDNEHEDWNSMSESDLNGKSIVVTGVFENHSRVELKKIIESHGGKPSSSVSKNTAFILSGSKMGPNKKVKAEELNIRIFSEEEFIKKYGG